MRHHGSLDTDEDANAAFNEAAKGAVSGAARWGIYSALLGAAGVAFSPAYRGLTIQFKVFMQMSGMTLGGWIHADHRMREHEGRVRRERRVARRIAEMEKAELSHEVGNTGKKGR
ncbi:MAG: hypothetical protein M1839_005126 [Geoglossum umbratile]|nr:MAG: hypothetical protein M1839_005126 [Geoglossum umbratile]